MHPENEYNLFSDAYVDIFVGFWNIILIRTNRDTTCVSTYMHALFYMWYLVLKMASNIRSETNPSFLCGLYILAIIFVENDISMWHVAPRSFSSHCHLCIIIIMAFSDTRCLKVLHKLM